ncbi:MAG: ABC transporter permease [Clostridia bacterium]|nr:ABC transporter permease [Clostridia bacterium]
MLNYIIKRAVLTVVVLFIVSFITFSLIHILPGDPAAAMLGDQATMEEIEALRHELWLDRPFFVQYGHWLSNALQGDFGKSIMYRVPVSEIIAERLPVTLYLSFLSLILSTFIGIGAGIICAIRRGSLIDQIVSVVANAGVAVPIFWLGLLGIYVFGFTLEWLPLQGWTSPFDDFLKSSKQALMPVICLSVTGSSIITRQTRSSLLEVIRQDYIRTAWAKGMGEPRVVFKHALKNALIPVVTLVGLQLRVLVGGAVLTETVFNIPGMGRLLVDGALAKDFLIVQAGVLLIAVMVSLANLITDISHGWLDPRIRYD